MAEPLRSLPYSSCEVSSPTNPTIFLLPKPLPPREGRIYEVRK